MAWEASVAKFIEREQSDELGAERAAFLATWPKREWISKNHAHAIRAVTAASLRNPEERALATTSLPRKVSGEIEAGALDGQRAARAAALMTVRNLYKSLLRHMYGAREASAAGA